MTPDFGLETALDSLIDEFSWCSWLMLAVGHRSYWRIARAQMREGAD